MLSPFTLNQRKRTWALAASSVLLALATLGSAAPTSPANPAAPALLQRRDTAVSPAAGLPPFFQPEASHSYTYEAPQTGFVAVGEDELNRLALKAVADAAGLAETDVKMTSRFFDETSTLSFVHAVQVLDGVPISNAVATVAVDPQGTVIALSHSFVPKPAAGVTRRSLRARDTSVPVEVAVSNIGALLGLETQSLTVSTDAETGVSTVTGATWAEAPITVKKVHYATPAGALAPSYFVDVAALGTIYNCFVATENGEVLGCSDLSSKAFHNLDGGRFEEEVRRDSLAAAEEANAAGDDDVVLERRQTTPVKTVSTLPDTISYKVVPYEFFSTEQTGGATTVVNNPSDSVASPKGWHSFVNANTGATEYNNAPSGNNVFAVSNPKNSATPTSLPLTYADTPFQFLYTADGKNSPTANTANTMAGVTNMFYTSNIMHDLFLRYGFTEAAGNFQKVNFGGQGAGNDQVVALAQDGSGTNNANFLTPADGSSGRMRMYVFTQTSPNRDGALDNGVVMHELTHGLSNRLTGGPANANCLQTTQAGGMGEGWSDMVSVLMNVKPTDTRATNKAVGTYVLGNTVGVRTYPYSTSLTTNPWKFSALASSANQEVHVVGEVWCTMLYEVLWNMIEQGGFVPVTSLPDSTAVGTAGNSDFFLILLRGMMLQPCNPTFIQARDAIVAADKAITGGKYNCAIWKGFAKRGLGVNAKAFTNNADLPSDCA
ncbi:Fungalysin metallopeptidase-domain-containing protein [Zopfochytrium polystomum]|nr:Fungalysin metallopeptidase-domain-containing protein [Zopfochytrium polystomum]